MNKLKDKFQEVKNMANKIGTALGKIVGTLSKWTTIIFITLRACDVIDWEWYWVLSPSVISLIIGILGLAFVGAAVSKD